MSTHLSLPQAARAERTPAVIALHCSGGSGRAWRNISPALGGCFNVLAPDLIGNGTSPHWRGPGRFRLADEAAASQEARRSAVADARRRAATIAEALGGGLGPLVAVSEGTPAGPSPFREAKLAFAAVAADAPTPVLPGAVEVSVTVTAAWELLPGAG